MSGQELALGYEACREIMRKHGKSYYFATSLFGEQEMKRSTWALYAFFRIPDDVVDENVSRGEAQMRLELDEYEKKWRASLQGDFGGDSRLLAIADTFHRRAIPAEYGESFLASMRMDIDKKTYQTYAELEEYMYGSAGVVGYMMAIVIGFKDEKALGYAKTLGYAMQLTNFLRDLDADWQQLRRIYMPQDELVRFGLSSLDIQNRKWSPEFREFMRFQVARARDLYQEGNKCLPLLNPKGRFAYAMASRLYERILDKLAAQDYNPFSGRVSTSFAEKLRVLFKEYFINNY